MPHFESRRLAENPVAITVIEVVFATAFETANPKPAIIRFAARVTMNEGSPVRVTKSPLPKPTATATVAATAIDNSSG
jgi:hypothetical protein